MASPGAYASPLRENQVGLFGDGANQPPTPPTNVRVLIAQKEKVRDEMMNAMRSAPMCFRDTSVWCRTKRKDTHVTSINVSLTPPCTPPLQISTSQELVALSEQRLNQLNARAVDIEERLKGKEVELAQTRTQFQQLTADFRYNLKLLEDRDAELERLDGTVAVHRAACDKAEQNLAHARSLVNEKDSELRRQKSRVGELEAYHAEKVERLRKQTDEARYTRDDQLQRQKDDFANLERQLVRQVEEQKAAIELERKELIEKNEKLVAEKIQETEVPVNNLRRELSDEKAQTLAIAAELEAWRTREENTRKELAKSEAAKRAAEANAIEVYEKLSETEAHVGVLRDEVAELRAFKELAPEQATEQVQAAIREFETQAFARRDEEFKNRETETDRLRAKIKMLEQALEKEKKNKNNKKPASSSRVSKETKKQSEDESEDDADRDTRGTQGVHSSSSKKNVRKKGSVSKTPRRVTIREASSDDDDVASSSQSSDSGSQSESDESQKRKSKSKKKHGKRRSGAARSDDLGYSPNPIMSPTPNELTAPPSIGKEKPDAVLAASAAAAAIAEMEHKIKVRDLRRRGDDLHNVSISSSQVERMWSALPPRVPQISSNHMLSKEDIEIAAMRAVEAALSRSGLSGSDNPVRVELKVNGEEAEEVDPENVSPRTKLKNAKKVVEASSSMAVLVRKTVRKKKATKPRLPLVSTSKVSSPVHGTFGKKKKNPSSLAATEAREVRLLNELEGKVAALSGGRIRSGRSTIRKALR